MEIAATPALGRACSRISFAIAGPRSTRSADRCHPARRAQAPGRPSRAQAACSPRSPVSDRQQGQGFDLAEPVMETLETIECDWRLRRAPARRRRRRPRASRTPDPGQSRHGECGRQLRRRSRGRGAPSNVGTRARVTLPQRQPRPKRLDDRERFRGRPIRPASRPVAPASILGVEPLPTRHDRPGTARSCRRGRCRRTPGGDPTTTEAKLSIAASRSFR